MQAVTNRLTPSLFAKTDSHFIINTVWTNIIQNKYLKVLITGAAGFIGGHLYTKLTKLGHKVIGIDNFFHPSKNKNNDAIFNVDIRNIDNYYTSNESHVIWHNPDLGIPNTVKLVEWADIVYHLAAQIHVDYSIHNPVETVDINVNGTIKILEACKKYGKKLVFASSSEIYGSTPGDISESTRLHPQSPYAVTKVTGDQLCSVYKDIYGMKIDVIRNFNTFGPYQNDTSYGGVIAIFTRRALAGEPLQIYGDGTQERDYMYIDDALQGYLMSLESDLPGPTNFGTGKTVTINRLAELIKAATNSNSEIVHVAPRLGEVTRLCANIETAKQLGFKPTTNLEEDLIKYTEWYKTNGI